MYKFEFEYSKPTFDLSAPVELVRRAGDAETPLSAYRSEFMRDRDRVMYSSAFRRLAGKTQIYLAGTDDHRRNRLTHTLKVSQIARTISSALNLNCDLTEAIALGHDIGHTPFGHAGEQILHEIMVPGSSINIKNSPMTAYSKADNDNQNFFGFKHNVQGLRIATTLEKSYGKYGLNLTNYTLWGILHHSSIHYKEGRVNTIVVTPGYWREYESSLKVKGNSNKEAWSFEGLVVAWADEIAQWHHDLEDALRGDAMTLDSVHKAIQENFENIMTDADKERLNESKECKDKERISSKDITDISKIMVNSLVNCIVNSSMDNLNHLVTSYGITSANKTAFFLEHRWDEPEIKDVIGFIIKNPKNAEDKEAQEQNKERLEAYPHIISEKVHHSCGVERMNAKGQYIIKKLFQAYYSHPQQLPDNAIVRYMLEIGEYQDFDDAIKDGIGAVREKFDKKIQNRDGVEMERKIKLMRTICDHIAGMTDHYAIEEYKKLYE